jgi:hypothetical protein
MSTDTREAPFVIENDDATDAGERGQIIAGEDNAASRLDRIEVIEQYISELIEVIGEYEPRGPRQQTKVAEQTPVGFLKRDLLNLLEESRINAVCLKTKLKSATPSAGKRSGYLN